MAVHLPELPALSPVEGVRLGATAAGVRKPGRTDLVLIELAPGSVAAACFTRNRFRAAPVILAERHLTGGAVRYLLINSGNANAGTGEAGLADALACCAAVAQQGGVEAEAVLPYSTGVIGERLPVGRITDALPAAFEGLSDDGWSLAARGIMTTDTGPKGLSLTTAEGATLTGIAKGAGMIRPDMATMLAYVATDAALTEDVACQLLREATDRSFNRISVDGDTSTNDAVTLVATGRHGDPIDDPAHPRARAFGETLTALCRHLAQCIVRDGEGATRFVTIRVEQARDVDEAAQVAFTIAHSPLVKTALFAGDPNWGRILAAVGRAGVDDLDVSGVSLWLGDVLLAERGGLVPGYREEDGAAEMAREEVVICVALGRGQAQDVVWTTDLSYEYVKINAEYRS